MHLKCTKESAGEACLKLIKQGLCPCLINSKLHHPDSGGCILAIQTLLNLNFCLLVNQLNNQIIFCRSDKKKFPAGYKIYPAIERGENKKCLPPQFMIQGLS